MSKRKAHNLGKKLFKCEQVDCTWQGFDEEEFEFHKLYHEQSNLEHTCEKCNKKFCTYDGVLAHYSTPSHKERKRRQPLHEQLQPPSTQSSTSSPQQEPDGNQESTLSLEDHQEHNTSFNEHDEESHFSSTLQNGNASHEGYTV